MIEFYDEDKGSVVWRVDYDPTEESLRLHFGPTCENWWYKGTYKHSDFEGRVFELLRQHAQSSVEKVLLGD